MNKYITPKNTFPIGIIKDVSTETWNRIKFVYNSPHKNKYYKINEVTITQNLIYELYKKLESINPKPFYIYESTNERTSGADILLCIRFDDRYIKIPIQAKIITPNNDFLDGKYKHIHHQNMNGNQVELLQSYANKIGNGLGFYLFYNYTEGSKSISENEKYYGCSYAEIEPIKKLKKIKFSTIHSNIAKPWYHLFLMKPDHFLTNQTPPPDPPDLKPNHDELIDFYNKYNKTFESNTNIKTYSKDEIRKDDTWVSLISTLPIQTEKSDIEKNEVSFSPRYRIVVENIYVGNGKLMEDSMVDDFSKLNTDRKKHNIDDDKIPSY